MGLSIGQLPQEIQDAVNVPQQSVQVPMAPSGQGAAPQAPDIGQNAPPQLTGVDLLAQTFLNHLISKDKASQPQPPAQNPTQRGGFADKLSSAINGVSAGLGDAAAAGKDVRPGSGWLGGVEKTLAAHSQRTKEEQDTAFRQSEEKKKTDANLAIAHVDLIRQQQGVQKQSEDLRQASLTDGRSFVKGYEDAGYPVESSVPLSVIQKRKAGDKDYDSTHTAVKTAETPLLGSDGQPKKDGDGNIIYTPTYSVVDMTHPPQGGGNVKTTAEAAKYYKDNLGMDVPEGTPLPVASAIRLNNQAHAVADSMRIMEKDNGQAMDAKLADQIREDVKLPAVQAAINKYPGRALKGVAEFRANEDQHTAQLTQQIADLQSKNPQDPQIAPLQEKLKQVQSDDAALARVQANGFNEKAQQDELAAQREDEKARHDQAEERIQNRRADVQAQKETAQKGLGDSYKTENKEFDTIRKPIATQLDSFSTLRSSLDQGTAAGDAIVAPALLKALVAGGGVRITQAEIHQFTNGRSTLEDMKGYLQKIASGKSITPEQRKQVYSLVGAVEVKAQQKQQILEDGQDALDAAQNVDAQRAAVANTRRKLAAVDSGQTTTQQPNTQKPSATQPPAGSIGVADPTGTTHYFKTQAEADNFKKLAGIK